MKKIDPILHELKEIEAKLSALIARVEAAAANNSTVVTTVSEIRRVAVLEEVFRNGGSAVPSQISEFSKKYGKSPSSSAGYYSGKSPSLVASDDRTTRQLSETGMSVVKQARHEWGDDWLDRIPLDIIGNSDTPDAEVVF